MKNVKKDFSAYPKSIQRQRSHYITAISALEAARRWPDNYSSLYKANSVVQALNLVYYSKCAYCNQLPVGSPIQVDHFRPKKGVRGITHTGYYWLGYEWTNLLLSCGNCNSIKNNKFALEDENTRLPGPKLNGNLFDQDCHYIHSKYLSYEKYQFLNPEVDKISRHLVYLPDGKIYGLSPRGVYTIDELGLNRDELYIDGRKKLIDDIERKLLQKLKRYSEGMRKARVTCQDLTDVIIEEIIRPIEQKQSFDDFLLIVMQDFQTYILPRFGNQSHKNILSFTFNSINMGKIF